MGWSSLSTYSDGLSAYIWSVIGYARKKSNYSSLCFGSSMLIALKAVLFTSLSIFMTGSLLCGLSPVSSPY